MSTVALPLKELFAKYTQVANDYRRQLVTMKKDMRQYGFATPQQLKEYVSSNGAECADIFAEHCPKLIPASVEKAALEAQIYERTGLTAVKNGKKAYALVGHIAVPGDSKPYYVRITSENIHRVPDNVGSMAEAARQGVVLPPESHAAPAANYTSKTTVKPEFLAAEKEALTQWAQKNRVLGSFAGAIGVGAGVAMSVDGFSRLRKGLGYDVSQDGKPAANTAQAALGAGEMLAGTCLATIGTYTGLMAIKGKGVHTPGVL